MATAESPADDAPKPGADGTAEPPQPPEPGPQTTATSQPDGPTPEEIAAKAAADAAKAAAATKPAEPRRDYAAERTQERINKLTAQKAALEAEVAKLRSGQSADAQAIQTEIATKAAELAQAEAQKIAAWNTFTGALNGAIAEGQREFGTEKFDASVQALRSLHDQTDPEANSKYLSMLQAVLDTGAAPKLIAQLGADPSEAARIMGLTPTKMGVELGKLAFREADEVSRAPKPLTPVSGVGRNHVAIAAEDPDRADGLDMRVWMERRAAHVQQTNARAGRRVIP